LISEGPKRGLKSRLPRLFYGRERIYKAYNEAEAKIQKFLNKQKPLKYSSFILLESVFLREKLHGQTADPTEPTLCLWITIQKIFLISLEKKKIVWKVKPSNIAGISTDDSSVSLILKNPIKTSEVITQV
jgi:hypothetical protein